MAVLTRFKTVLSRYGYRRDFHDLETMGRVIQATSRDALFGGFDSVGGGRRYEDWTGQHCVLADIDTPGGSGRAPLSEEQLEVLEQRMPSAYPTLWYPSRRGCRVFFVLREPVADLGVAKSVCRGAWAMLRHVLDGTGLASDDCTARPVQLNRGPGVARVRMPGYVWEPEYFVRYDPGHAFMSEVRRQVARFDQSRTASKDQRGPGASNVWPIPSGRRAHSSELSIHFHEAAARWSSAHPVPDLGRPGTEWACPVCGSSKGFGRLGTDGAGDRWVCFSSRHDPDVGRLLPSGDGFWGDSLDLASWLRRTTPQDLLVADGWLVA